jgi:hypothetical protein
MSCAPRRAASRHPVQLRSGREREHAALWRGLRELRHTLGSAEAGRRLPGVADAMDRLAALPEGGRLLPRAVAAPAGAACRVRAARMPTLARAAPSLVRALPSEGCASRGACKHVRIVTEKVGARGHCRS